MPTYDQNDYEQILHVIKSLETIIAIPNKLPKNRSIGNVSVFTPVLIDYVNSIETPNKSYKLNLSILIRDNPHKYKKAPENLDFINYDPQEIAFLEYRANLNLSIGDFEAVRRDIIELLIPRRKVKLNEKTKEFEKVNIKDGYEIINISNPLENKARSFFNSAIKRLKNLSLEDRVDFNEPLINMLDKKLDGNYIPILIDLEKAVYIDPKNTEYLFKISRIVVLMNEYNKNIMNNKNYTLLSELYLSMDNSHQIINQAKDYINQLLRIDPNHQIGITDRFVINILSEGVKISSDFFIELDKTLKKGVEQQKILDFVLERYNELLIDPLFSFRTKLNDGIIIFESNLESIHNYNRTYEIENLEQGIIKLSERYSLFFPNSVKPYIARSEVLFHKLNFDEALKINKDGLDLAKKVENEDIPLLYQQRIKLLKFSNQYDEALNCCDQLISMQPQSTYGYSSKSEILFNMGDYDKALKNVNVCLSLYNLDQNPFLKLKADILFHRFKSAPVFNQRYYDEAEIFFKPNERFHSHLYSIERLKTQKLK
jgi:hypothetical protein